MIVGLVSDSHDNLAAVERAAALFRSRGALDIIHCGDVCEGSTLDLFTGFRLRVCLGNNDDPRDLQRAADRIGGAYARELSITVDGKSFFVAHGDRWEAISGAAGSGKYDYVLHGHTHVRADRLAGNTRVINPGALHRAARWTIALLDPSTGTLETLDVPRA